MDSFHWQKPQAIITYSVTRCHPKPRFHRGERNNKTRQQLQSREHTQQLWGLPDPFFPDAQAHYSSEHRIMTYTFMD